MNGVLDKDSMHRPDPYLNGYGEFVWERCWGVFSRREKVLSKAFFLDKTVAFVIEMMVGDTGLEPVTSAM